MFQHRHAQARKGLEFDLERRLVGPADAAFEFGQLGGGKAHGIGHGLAMDKSLPMRLFEQFGALCRRHFHEIAQNAIVADLEGAKVGLFHEARLQGSDHRAGLACQITLGVERLIIAPAHETAIAAEQRQLVVQRLPQFTRKAFGRSGQRFSKALEGRGDTVYPGEVPRQSKGSFDPLADAGQIARSTPFEMKPRKRPCQVRHRLEVRAQPPGQGHVGGQERHGIEPLVDRSCIRQGRCKARGKEPRAGRGNREVDGLAQRALGKTTLRLVQFEGGARGGIDGHQAGSIICLGRA